MFKLGTPYDWEKHYYDKKILPDHNKEFAEKVIATIQKWALFIDHHKNTYSNLSFEITRIVQISRFLDSFSKELHKYEALIETVIETDRLMKKKVSDVKADLQKLQEGASELQDQKEVELKKIHGKLLLDKRSVATLIWELKHIIEKEIKRRRSCKPKLRLSPPPDERQSGDPSYRRRWELIAKIIFDFFAPLYGPYKVTVGDVTVERDNSHLFPFPFSAEAIRRHAYRYKPPEGSPRISL